MTAIHSGGISQIPKLFVAVQLLLNPALDIGWRIWIIVNTSPEPAGPRIMRLGPQNPHKIIVVLRDLEIVDQRWLFVTRNVDDDGRTAAI